MITLVMTSRCKPELISRQEINTLGFNCQNLTFFRILEISCQSHDSERAVAMVDSATHGRPISIGRGQWSHSRVISGSDPVSVDTCAVPREPTTLTCLAADLSRLPCEQDPRSTNAFNGLWAHAGGQTQREFSK